MPRDRRLTRPGDFAAVRRQGRSFSDRLLVLLVRRNGLQVTRVGFSVGKRVGKAVQRNKAKRRLRESVRLTPVQEGWDLVVIARSGAATADYRALSRSVASLSKRAGILAAPGQRVSRPTKAR